jgi:hydroxymethylpyrimidine/phosphomethylpyrimidine kinase
MTVPQPHKLLTIAGSDSGGAAGLQADLRVWTVLGAYGMSVVTAVTAQNSLAVKGIEFMPGNFIKVQMDAVLSDYGADAVKTGFLGRREIVEDVSAWLSLYTPPNIVIDPVLVNHMGEAMFAPDVVQAYVGLMFPIADLVTPNRREAELLTGLAVKTVADVETAVRHIHAFGPQNVLIKGGRKGNELVDVLFDGEQITHFSSPHVYTHNTHGSGDTLSAAICAFLAMGDGMETAVRRAHHLTHTAIQNAAAWQFSHGHGPVWPARKTRFLTGT